MLIELKNRQIEKDNRVLFGKIREIMERKAYKNSTIYDNKKLATRTNKELSLIQNHVRSKSAMPFDEELSMASVQQPQKYENSLQ